MPPPLAVLRYPHIYIQKGRVGIASILLMIVPHPRPVGAGLKWKRRQYWRRRAGSRGRCRNLVPCGMSTHALRQPRVAKSGASRTQRTFNGQECRGFPAASALDELPGTVTVAGGHETQGNSTAMWRGTYSVTKCFKKS